MSHLVIPIIVLNIYNCFNKELINHWKTFAVSACDRARAMPTALGSPFQVVTWFKALKYSPCPKLWFLLHNMHMTLHDLGILDEIACDYVHISKLYFFLLKKAIIEFPCLISIFVSYDPLSYKNKQIKNMQVVHLLLDTQVVKEAKLIPWISSIDKIYCLQLFIFYVQILLSRI